MHRAPYRTIAWQNAERSRFRGRRTLACGRCKRMLGATPAFEAVGSHSEDNDLISNHRNNLCCCRSWGTARVISLIPRRLLIRKIPPLDGVL